MKILLTGAHLTPALAMIDHIQARHPKDKLVYVGRLFSQEKLAQKAVEASEVKARGVKFIAFSAVKFVNSSLFDRLFSFFSFPKTVKEAKEILKKERPDVVLSFGSYLAVPFALAAKTLKIPLVTHEQTIAMGKANQFIAKLADKVAISYPQTADYLNKKNYTVTGNPVRNRIFAKNLKRPKDLPAKFKKLVLIMGGNQGSFAINEAVGLILTDLLKDYTVVHQCGRANKLKDYPKELKKIRQDLPEDLKEKYVIKEWINEEDLFWIYQKADFAISRAGANSVLELCLVPLPAILIPLPKAYNDEQQRNALMMKNAGGAIILPQADLSSEKLLRAIKKMEACYKVMRQKLAKKSFYQDSEKKLYQLLVDAKH